MHSWSINCPYSSIKNSISSDRWHRKLISDHIKNDILSILNSIWKLNSDAVSFNWDNPVTKLSAITNRILTRNNLLWCRGFINSNRYLDLIFSTIIALNDIDTISNKINIAVFIKSYLNSNGRIKIWWNWFKAYLGNLRNREVSLLFYSSIIFE